MLNSGLKALNLPRGFRLEFTQHPVRFLSCYIQVNWGSSAQAYTFVQALRYTRRLDGIGHHVKNFRPHCLVLTGHPHDRPNLTYLVSQITKNVSLMVYANVLKEAFGMLPEDESDVEWMRKHKIKAFRAVTTGKQCTAELLKSCLLFNFNFFISAGVYQFSL